MELSFFPQAVILLDLTATIVFYAIRSRCRQ